ncbi:MAG: methionyl-tRNA formyltransferase [Alphaproteobacteria bacterium]|nr:methionyl-tRNA formyltransferase [Alphaproteobacteria bacterium]
MRVVFMGTPAFAATALAAIADAGHEVACAYSQPPRPAGRGHRETLSEVHELAVARGIPVRTPARLRDPAEHAAFAALDADIAVVAAYGLILPRPVLDAPRHGCINIHASLLPRWRGAAPIQRAILAGDHETGVCIMRMEEGLDTGPVLMREAIAIGEEATAGTLHDALAALGARLVVDALRGIAAGTLRAEPQPDVGITYASKIAKDEARLAWARPAAELARAVRGFNPFPGAFFELGGERIRVLAARAEPGSGAPGTALDDALLVACGEGALRALVVQRAGRGAMKAPDFLRGRAVPAGTTLS